MIDSFVTQCPHCQTRFRLTRAQLGAARGEVRCGACLKVFNAGQQLFSESLRGARPAAPLVVPVASPPQDALPITPALQPAADAPTTPRARAPVERRSEERRKEAERDKDEAARPANATPTTSTQPITLGAADGKIEPRLGNAEPSESPAAKPPRPANAPLAHATEPLEQPAAALERSAAPLEPEPLEPLERCDAPPPDWQPPKNPWGRRLGWGLLSLLAALGLLGQYTWYNFDELARQNQYRPWLEYACPLLGCSLPAKVDIRMIKSSNLVVRSHPQFGGALQVDAILYNRASFSQPFPLLEMRFADRNDQLLASRRFTPSEYLTGDQAEHAQMPQQTPIHITLEILDPGPQAVNYSLRFHSPQ